MMANVGAELAPGMRIDRYQLLFRLGKGGMGEVWAAGKTQAALDFHKLVALKVLRTRNLESNAAVMFFDEAKAASVLQHAAIVNTTDLGQDNDILYIAMDLVKGPSLTALLQRLVITQKKMSPAMVAHIGIALASALDYAHDRALANGQPLKLVHRDVSPHNVLLDLNGSVRLTDFGVARTSIQDHESRVGTVRGKPSYMAPEQVVGGKIDARTDLFALGIVLYESACLKRLFGRSQPVKSMDAVMKHEPKALPDLIPGFPQTLWSVLRKALQKDPRERFQSAGEMHAALTHAAQGLEGFASAGRDLVELVQSVFDADAFDTDARVQEALAQAAPMEAQAEPTANQRVKLQAGGIQVVPVDANVAWPSADASDPLAPEAIEEAKTAYRAIMTPVGLPAMAMPSPMQSGSMDAFTPYGSGQSYTAMQSRPERSSMPALLATVAALLLVGTTAFVIASRSRDTAPIPAEVPQSTAEISPAPSVAPSVAAQPRITRPPAHTIAPLPEEPDPVEPAPAPTKARRAVVKKTPDKVAGETAPSATPDATFDEVRALLKKVRAVDPDKASAMFATMVEAGNDNKSALNELRRQAQRILVKSGP